MITGRRILLGVSGGVAAYKAAYLARRLVEAGADLETIMTQSAQRFLGRQTMAAISGRQPHVDMFDSQSVSPHTELGRWADAIVIYPATSATIARIANGLSEDLLSATVLASIAPVLVAPAMHTEMWEQPATRRNIELLERDKRIVVGPDSGALAGGDVGVGRVVEPAEALAALDGVFESGPLDGWRVLVTAGGTREAIDPVRYVGNRSTGKMGNAVAIAAARQGASVTLVTTVSAPSEPRINVVAVETAEEMARAVWDIAGGMDVAVMAAAVADFKPESVSDDKLRRVEGPPDIDLVPTPDVLAGVAALEDRPFLVGFAAETGPAENAVGKAKSKGVDLLVANDVTAAGSGFGTDTNAVTLIHADGSTEPWELASKEEVASRLWSRIVELRETH